ncbi:MAG TPA: 2-C-methyl-D-erythritol 4-phosphate cytidylyltransferase [Pyrinomonadaceae bacterium]|nr:2-C-methyl-D-erythritol 4-phosphate cytidylyltransferase [Pyrinomonadaceae bacterium]
MNVAIVVAGGKGVRFGGDRPKQFLEVNGSPIIIHTLRQFERCREIGSVVVVLPAEETAGFQSLIEKFALQKVSRIVAGGATRAQSVKQGLAAIDNADVVAVHDGVRPLVAPDEIDDVVRAAREVGSAILVTAVADTIKDVRSNRVINTLPRVNLRRALTPQCFRLDILRRAYEQLEQLEAAAIEVADDSFLVERLGVEVATIEGSARNIKITKEEDLTIADALLRTF